MKPNLHITSDDGTVNRTLVQTADGEALWVTKLALTLDAKESHWRAELEFSFPELDIWACSDTAEAWERLHRARAQLDEIERQLRAMTETAPVQP
jgi:hypothetical protein